MKSKWKWSFHKSHHTWEYDYVRSKGIWSKACFPLLSKIKPDAFPAVVTVTSLICVLRFPRLIRSYYRTVKSRKQRTHNSDITTHLHIFLCCSKIKVTSIKCRWLTHCLCSILDFTYFIIRKVGIGVLPVSWCQHTPCPPADRGRDKG